MKKYEIIVKSLSKQILDNHFQDGRLPPLLKLAEEYSVSLMTMNKAVNILKSAGLVICNTGRNGIQVDPAGVQQMKLRSGIINSWSGSDSFSVQTVTLNYLVFRRGTFSGPLMEQFIEKFESRYPWCKINMEIAQNPESIQNKDISEYDIIQGSNVSLMPLSRKNLLKDLSPYTSAFGISCGNMDISHGIPLQINTPLIYYNRQVVKQPPKNWDDFLQLCFKLRKEGKYSVSNITGLSSFLYNFIGNLKTNLNSNDAGIRQAFDILYYLFNWNLPWNNFSYTGVREGLKKEEIVVLVSYFSPDKLSPPNSWSTIMPHQVNGIPLLASVKAGIGRNSQHSKDAWLFINFLHSPEVQKMIVEHNYGIPANLQVFNHEFKNIHPELHQQLEGIFKNNQETYISEEIRNHIYMRCYPMLEQCFSSQATMDKTIALFKQYAAELLMLDDIQE